MASFSAEELRHGVPAVAFAEQRDYEASPEYLQQQRDRAALIVTEYLTLADIAEIMPTLRRMRDAEVGRRQNGE